MPSCPTGETLGQGNYCVPPGEVQCGATAHSCPSGTTCSGQGNYCMPPGEVQCGATAYSCPSGTTCSGSGSSWTCPSSTTPPTTPADTALTLAQNPIINTPSTLTPGVPKTPGPAPASGSLSPSPLSAPVPVYTPPDTPPATEDFWSITFLDLNIKWWLVIGGVALFLLLVFIMLI